MVKLFKNISIYSLGNILNKGVMFLLLPLYTRVLQPADYGKLELVYLVGAILALLYGLQVENGYNRIFFDNKDTHYRKKLFATGQIFNLFCSAVFASIMLFNADWFAQKIFNFEEGVFYLQLVVIITILEVLMHIPLNNIRIRQEAKTFVLANLFKLVIVTSLTVIFVVFAAQGVVGVLYAKMIGGLLTLLLLYFITRKEYSFGFSYAQLKLMLGFSIFLIPPSLSALILNMSNRYFLQEYQTLDDVGLYSLGAKLAGIIPFLFTEPVKKAFSPFLFENMHDIAGSKKLLADFSRLFFAGLSVIALAISLFSREAVMIIADASYAGSHNIVFILSISYLFLGLAGIIVLGIHIVRKTWVITIIWVISALLNIIFNILLIPSYGRMGAAVATLLSIVSINIMYFLSLKLFYPVRFDYDKFIIILVFMVLFSLFGSFLAFTICLNLLIKMMLLLMFVYIVYFSGILKKNELNKIKKALSGQWNKNYKK